MERRSFGMTGMQVSVLGFGGAEIGFQGADPQTVSQLLNSALDAGLNVIDTAECYANSEELIGQAVSHRRQDYYLFTKCGHAAGFDLPDWSPSLLEQSIERSLRLLKTDCLDLVQLHTCSEETLRQGDVIAVLQRVRDAGKTRFIGYSGDRTDALYAVTCGAFDSLQISINIADQQAIDLVLPKARERQMGVIVKRPIANAVWRGRERPSGEYYQPYWDRLQALQYDFLKGDLRDSIGIALRFTAFLPGVHTLIVGTTQPERWQQNAALLEAGPLPAELYAAIRQRWQAVAGEEWVGQT